MIFLITNKLCKVQVFQTFIFQLQIQFELFLDSYADASTVMKVINIVRFFFILNVPEIANNHLCFAKNIQNRLLRIQFAGINQSTQVSAGVCTVQCTESSHIYKTKNLSNLSEFSWYFIAIRTEI